MSFLSRPFRLPRLRPYVPEPDDPSIFWFNSERDDIIREVVKRVVERFGRDSANLEYTLNEVAFEETRRLERQKDDEARQELGYWRGLLRRVARMSDDAKRDALEGIAHRMATDVAGNFDPRVYRMASNVMPQLLAGVMQPASLPARLTTRRRAVQHLEDLLGVQGATEHLRALERIGTLVYVPTHSSNVDSLALGLALFREKLAPCVYGAGKNLFTNPIISFFMHNLGAYRVDRRVKAGLYKLILKTYSAVIIERGFHSLFFPGGTRSRSGMVERRLKLGLAGTAFDAFSRNQVYGRNRPVFFVPTTINYGLVMEAETLIRDHLSEQGKARYIIEDDEFSRLDRWLAFFRKLVGTDGACIIRFGQPMDPFGNPVDEAGRSIGPSGRPLDAGSYVLRHGRAVLDEARDAAYTRELGEVLLEVYKKETVLMPENVVAHVFFRRLVRETEGVDLFGKLRFRGEVRFHRSEFAQELGETRDRLQAMADRGVMHLAPALKGSPEDITERVLNTWDGYHTGTMVSTVGPDLVLDDPSLLFYYQNRLVDYAAGAAGEADQAAAREISQMGVPS